jgi:hypothetical protein
LRRAGGFLGVKHPKPLTNPTPRARSLGPRGGLTHYLHREVVSVDVDEEDKGGVG